MAAGALRQSGGGPVELRRAGGGGARAGAPVGVAPGNTRRTAGVVGVAAGAGTLALPAHRVYRSRVRERAPAAGADRLWRGHAALWRCLAGADRRPGSVPPRPPPPARA